MTTLELKITVRIGIYAPSTVRLFRAIF